MKSDQFTFDGWTSQANTDFHPGRVEIECWNDQSAGHVVLTPLEAVRYAEQILTLAREAASAAKLEST
jgi:hypothetical protein